MRGEAGFTLVEMVVATAIAGVIFGVLAMGFYHIVTVPDYGNEKMTALHELQNVAHRVNLDGQTALTATGGGSLSLTYPDASSVNYTLLGTDLVRYAAGSNNTLAQNIASVDFSVEGRIITLQLVSAPDGRWDVSENETYKICLRPTEE